MKQVSFSSAIQQYDCSWWRFDDDGEKASDGSSDPTWLSRQGYNRIAKREKALVDGLKSGDIHFHDEFLITNGLETPNDRMQRHLRIRAVLLAVLSEQQEQQQSREQQENCYLSTTDIADEILARVSLATTQKSTFLARERGIVLENYVSQHSNNSNRKDQSPCYNGFRSSCFEDRNSNKKDDVTGQQHHSSYKAENDQHQHQSGSIISKEPSTTATQLEEEIMPTPVSPIREGRWQTYGGSTETSVTFTAKSAATASMVPKDISPALLISQRKATVAVAY